MFLWVDGHIGNIMDVIRLRCILPLTSDGAVEAKMADMKQIAMKRL